MPRLADPHAELPVKNFKYVTNCIEMLLSKRRIEQIANFEPFVNLEVLWINGNEIETLEGLDTCVRIKYLYAQNNRIRTLEGSSLKHFTFLKELRLYDNKLKDLHGTLAVLSKLHHLEDLDLFGNPLQEEENYRLQVIKAVPSLVVLDRHVITDGERAKAERALGVAPSALGVTKKKRAAVIAGAPPQEMSGTVKLLFKEVAAFQREQQTKDRKAAERELLELSNAHKTKPASSSFASKPKRADAVENLDDWELAALRTRFHALEEKKNIGVRRDSIGELLALLASRGYAISVDGTPLGSDVASTEASALVAQLFPSQDRVAWVDLMQHQIHCEVMAAAELTRQAARCFSRSEELQMRAKTMATSDASRQLLVKESLELSQQAYHLQTLVERLSAVATAPSTAFTSTFSELNEQNATHVDAALAAKYRLQHKDYAKYLHKQTPAAATLVKRTFHL
ncbi:hypothetical protein PybrP1_004410 [[Pythium] brassicae (nom. inval.)]|nr:hypothetical protein PybrP1_004410 [[Pythium] brassicae (nom. inval.)]